MIRVTLVNVRWEPVEGATGWEIRKDGVKVATAGAKARTTRMSVDEQTLLEVVDLPARSRTQSIEFGQQFGQVV